MKWEDVDNFLKGAEELFRAIRNFGCALIVLLVFFLLASAC